MEKVLGKTFWGNYERQALAKFRKQVIAISKHNFCEFLAISVNLERVLRDRRWGLSRAVFQQSLDAFLKGFSFV